jgi:HlyD family secretion protein
MRIILVLFGVLLLVATAVGVMLARQDTTPHPGNVAPNDLPSGGEAPPYIFCLGEVGLEPPSGVVDMYPEQHGQVVELAPIVDAAGKERMFKQGETLLKVNDRLAKAQLEKAKAALKAAGEDLKKARLLPDQLHLKEEQQQAAIQAIEHKRTAAEAELENKKKNFKENIGNVTKNILTGMEELLKQLDEQIKAEKSKLAELKLAQPKLDIARAEADVDAKKADLEQATIALEKCELKAPADGTVLRVYAKVGEPLGPNPRLPALEFLPNLPRIVKAEVMQEWGRYVRVGQEATIEDDTSTKKDWKGRIKSVSDWYAPKRLRPQEPFMMNDVRTLECIVEFTEPNAKVRIGQRMRVKIKND